MEINYSYERFWLSLKEKNNNTTLVFLLSNYMLIVYDGPV